MKQAQPLSERELAEQNLLAEIELEQGGAEVTDTSEQPADDMSSDFLDLDAPLAMWPELPVDNAKIAQRVIATEKCLHC